MPRPFVIVLLLAAGMPQSAAAQPMRAEAARVKRPPKLDGVLDDEAWRRAPVIAGFVQQTPDEGAEPTQRTEVRVVYDDNALFFGFRCHDDNAEKIVPRLARRDQLGESDFIAIAIDSLHDRRSAFSFSVNAAGTLADGIFIEGDDYDASWDGVWDARAEIDDEGWSAEMRIPFASLRFEAQEAPVFGLHMRRRVSRRKENDDWSLIRATDAAYIALFGELHGIRGVQPGLSTQLLPYVSGTLRPATAPGSRAPREVFEPRFGGDLKYGVTGSLTLDVTVNPDFAQVEVDPRVLNLTAFEVFFSERRPFFLENTEAFTPVGPFLYTRRIGAAPRTPRPRAGGEVVEVESFARILGAARLSGTVRPGTSVGLLSAFVDDTFAIEEVPEAGGVRRERFSATPQTVYNVARLRQVVGRSSALGLIATSKAQLEGPDAHLLSADFDLRGRGDLSARGSVGWSFTDDCDNATGFCDAAYANLRAGKTGGELRALVNATYIGPEHNPNDVGFLMHRTGNQLVEQRTQLAYVRPRHWGPLAFFENYLNYRTAFNPEAAGGGVDLPMTRHRIELDGRLRLRSNHELGWTLSHDFPRDDGDETRNNAQVRTWRRGQYQRIWLRLRSDDARPFWAQVANELELQSEGSRLGISDSVFLWLGVNFGGSLTGGTRLRYRTWQGRRRWVGTGDDDLPLVSALELHQFDVELNATAAFSRDLTLQLFSQLLHAAQNYSRLYRLVDPNTPQRCGRVHDCGGRRGDDFDGDFTSVTLNAVLRWQYRPGSLAFLAYTNRSTLRGRSDSFDLGGALSTLSRRRTNHVVALKLSYLWSL